MIRKITIPKLNDNDMAMVVADIYVEENQFVESGDPLLTLETSKGTEDIDAPESGWVRGLSLQRWEEYEVGSLVCYLTEKADTPLPSVDKDAPLPEQNIKKGSQVFVEKEAQKGSEFSVTGKAGALLEAFNISPEKLKKKVIRSEDVLGKIIAGRDKKRFMRLIKNDPAFRELESDLKVLIYRIMGYQISERVFLGRGSLILSPEIVLEEGVSIGSNTVVECDDLMRIGRGTVVGPDGDIVSKVLIAGANNRIMEKVKIDLSGGGTKGSGVYIGDRCLISAGSYLNASRKVTLKDRVALSPGTKIFTHSFWQNVFDGYHSNFGNVTLEKNAWLGAGAQVLPNVTIGEGATVVSGSTVAMSVPPFTMVAGIPAKVLKKDMKKKLSLRGKERILDRIMGDFFEYLESRNCIVEQKSTMQTRVVSVVTARENSYTIAWPKAPDSGKKFDNLILIGFGDLVGGDTRVDLEKQEVSGKTNALTDELRNYLRRQGLDFTPYDWVYNFKTEL